MVKPHSIICAESGSQDKVTGLLSLFNVIEKFQIAKLSAPPAGQAAVVPEQRFLIAATWRKEDTDDPNQEYEFEFVLFMPPNGSEGKISEGGFLFSMPMHRITLNFRGLMPFNGGGWLRIEARLRKKGEQDWIKQDYWIIVEEIVTPSPIDAAPAQANPAAASVV
jgi:hypothetical protein